MKKNRSVGNKLAEAAKAEQGKEGISLHDFHAFMPTNKFIYAPTRELWVPESVDSCLDRIKLVDKLGKPLLDKKGNQKTVAPTTWLIRKKPVQQMVWAPGFSMIVRGRLVDEGGWIKRKGVAIFNTYRPPPEDMYGGDARKVAPWLKHAFKLFNKTEAEYVIRWLAYRVQHPFEKINHALLLGSDDQGVGKDTLLEPVVRGLGNWNFRDLRAAQAMGRFNKFLECIILRLSEVHDLGDSDRYKFYDFLKTYTAAPPYTLYVDKKHMPEYAIFNCVGIILTTNHRTDGLYLPPEDRRHYVAWSERRKNDFTKKYWNDLFRWYDRGGVRHVMAYLRALDVSDFDPKAPPPQTETFWEIVHAGQAPEENELADVLEKMGHPEAVTIEMIRNTAVGDFEVWLKERKNYRTINHRLQKCDYNPFNNPDESHGVWRVNGTRQRVYVRKDLSPAAKLKAVKELVETTK